MKLRSYIFILLTLAATLVVVSRWSVRWDLTEDKHYSISKATQTLVSELSAPIEVRLLLDGRLNPSFLKLSNATKELIDELSHYGTITYSVAAPTKDDTGIIRTLNPIVIHERQQQGQTVQTHVYPYAVVRVGERETVIPLLKNNRGLSGEENINHSIEQLEFAFAEALQQLSDNGSRKIAFIEGHGELSEREVYDLSLSLSRYFQIDRGSLTGDANDLLPYSAIIIAAPEEPYSDADKYQIDQYVMQGGKVMWIQDGVQFSEDILSSDGFTPIIQKDVNLQDILFRYGMRLTPTLLQDKQCLPIAVDVSSDPQQPNFQPMPWYYAPLLLASQASPIGYNLGSVSAMFCSAVEAVGGEDGIRKEVLLATSSSSRAISAPAEVDLSLVTGDDASFSHAYIPVAMLAEGSFPSLFQHRMTPDGVTPGKQYTSSQQTRQILIGSSSIARNNWQQGQPVPLGYDRYTGMQFANKDFLTNAVLYLTDNAGIIFLRQKDYTLRLLNDHKSHQSQLAIQTATCLTPLLILLIVGMAVNTTRRIRYRKHNTHKI